VIKIIAVFCSLSSPASCHEQTVCDRDTCYDIWLSGSRWNGPGFEASTVDRKEWY